MDRIEISAPQINKEAALANIAQAIENGQIAQGPQVKQAEEAMCEAFESDYASALSNGTTSLRSALIAASAVAQAVDKKYIDRYMPSREVIVPAFSFNATLNTVLQTGATARVVDISRDDFCIDRDQVVNALSDKTAAVMPVDLYGQASEISSQDPDFLDVAVVRDAAQAHGARLYGESIVAHGDATSLSFYPTKNIAAPEGGAVLTNFHTVDEIVKIYRNQGMKERYQYEMSGDNLRMSDIHAAILRANLGSLGEVTKRRQENATALSERLRTIGGLVVPKVLRGREHVWHQYTILVEDEFGMDRDELSRKLNENGIGNGMYYPKTMTDHPTFVNHPKIIKEATPIADDVVKRALSLPVHPKVSMSDIDRIADTISKVRKGTL